jgi:hypothetical protein
MLSVTSKTKHYELDFCIGLMSLGPFPTARPPILVLSDRTRVRVLKQAYAHGLSPDFDMDVVTGPSDATRASGLQNMYDSGAIARKDHLRKAPDRLYQTASSRNMESRSDLFNNG